MAVQPREDPVRRSLRILSAFSMDQPRMGVSELARRVGLPKSTVHRILRIMREEGFVQQDERTQEYRLGVRLFHLGSVVREQFDLISAARPVMERLRDLVNETVNLYMLDGYERVCVQKAESTHLVRQVVSLGQRIPTYCGAAGKVLVAWQDSDFIEAVISSTHLKRLTSNTIVDPSAFRQELRSIKRKGYGVSQGERDPDVTAVAAPIFSHDGKVTASLGVSGPRLRLQITDELVKELIASSEEISSELGVVVPSSLDRNTN